MSNAITTLEMLFTTLKDASNRNEAATEKLVDQQMELVTHIKSMPVEELRDALKQHADKSEQEIQDCNGTIELRAGDIIKEINKLSAKITKLLIVVSVALSVATSGYFLIRYAADQSMSPPNWEEKLQQIEKDQINKFNNRLDQRTDEIRKEMQTLYKNTHVNGDKVDERVHD